MIRNENHSLVCSHDQHCYQVTKDFNKNMSEVEDDNVIEISDSDEIIVDESSADDLFDK